MLRWLTAGESHGPALVALIEGLPAGVAVRAEVVSHVVVIGTAVAPDGVVPAPADRAAVDASPVRCLDAAASAAMMAEVDAAKADADTLGGIVEVVVHGLPPGLGSYVHW